MISDKGLMLDTNVFNRVADGIVDIAVFTSHQLVATHVQKDELQNTLSTNRKNALLEKFHTIDPAMLSTESAAWDVSAWDECKWSSDDLCEKIFRSLKERDKGRRQDANYWRDALIAETALKNELTLITEDRDLRDVTRENGGSALCLAEFTRAVV